MLIFAAKLISGVAICSVALLLSIIYDGVSIAFLRKVAKKPPISLTMPMARLMREVGDYKSEQPFTPFIRTSLSIAMLLVAFLYMPIGSLPAVFGTQGDMLVIYFSAAAAVGLVRDTRRISTLCVTACAIFTSAWFGLRTGMPGAPMSLETYVATSVWGVAGWYGLIGFTCLGAAFAMSTYEESGTMECTGRIWAFTSVSHALTNTLLSALFVNMFMPWSPGIAMNLPAGAIFVADFIFFWVKVLAVQTLGVAAADFLRVRFSQISAAGLSVAGMVLVTLDVMSMRGGG